MYTSLFTVYILQSDLCILVDTSNNNYTNTGGTRHRTGVLNLGPSKGFERQATQSENVPRDHFQSADKQQKLSGKSLQFATATNCMQHNHFRFCSKEAATFNTMEQVTATKQATGDTGYPLGGNLIYPRPI